MKFNNYVEAVVNEKASRGGSLEEVEKHVPEAVAEESRDQFNEEQKPKTPIAGHRPVRRESSWRQVCSVSVYQVSKKLYKRN